MEYELEFSDHFDCNDFNTQNWQPYYLSHWSSHNKTQPSYKIENSILTLCIGEKQKPWCPEFDGEVIVRHYRQVSFLVMSVALMGNCDLKRVWLFAKNKKH